MLNEHGYEIPDDTPVELPARLRLPQSRASQIQAYIRHELSRASEENGKESFEEADDLDVEGFEDMPLTPYEMQGLDGNPFLADAGGPPEAGAASPGGQPAPPAEEGVQPPADNGGQ